MGSTGRKNTVCLLLKFWPPSIHPELMMESKLKNQSSATLWVLETCLIMGLLPLIIILITASLSSNTHNKASWCENGTFEGASVTIIWNIDHSSRLVAHVILITANNKFFVLSWFWLVFPRTKTIRSHKSRAGTPLISILRPRRWFRILLNCAKLKFVSYTSNLLEQMYDFQKQHNAPPWSGFWVLKISCKIGVLKQSQSALFCSITHITILFALTSVMNVRYQSIQAFVTGLGSFCDRSRNFIHWP